MGLFRSKTSIEECCKQFYDTQIFHAIVGGVSDVWLSFCETVFKLVSEADPSFAKIDFARFQQEMTALRLEVFALACSHKVKEDIALRQSFFTRDYLKQNKRLDIWDIMGEYNQSVARSTSITSSGQPDRERGAWLNKLRLDMFEKWAEKNRVNVHSLTQKDEESGKCVARVTNRIGADMRWADAVATKLLAAKLAIRLEWDASLATEAPFRVATTIIGFYNGAQLYLKSFSLK